MTSLAALLYKVMDVFANNFVRSMLTSIGIGIAAGATVFLLLRTFIDTAIAQASSMPYLGLLSLFGIDTALSIIFGALLTKGGLEASKIRMFKK